MAGELASFWALGPRGTPPGAEQRFQIALDGNLKTDSGGAKVFVSRAEEAEKRFTFLVVASQAAQAKP